IIPQTLPNKRHWTIKHPVGVAATIAPWNFPVLLQARKLAPALAAGCTTVSRPASQTPLATMELFQCLADAGAPVGTAPSSPAATMELFQCLADAGAPVGTVNLVTGPPEEITQEFIDNRAVRKISFTGSTEVGKQLMRQAADQLKKL